jgi:BirA family biotin operon repressor/biotin-[acetyl-CoA-carboxylase] ligase
MITTKDHVLNIILTEQQEEEFISGQQISEKLKISRSAVNKAVLSLREDGYIIEAVNRKGYRIVSSPDLISYGELLTYLTPERLGTVSILDQVASTNVTLHEFAENGAESGQIVIASSQTKGRGRHGTGFDSPEDRSIYMSYLIRPQDSRIIDVKKCTQNTARIVCDAINSHISEKSQAEVRLPGDIFLSSRKICGILTELLVEAESNFIRYIMIGIGIRPLNNIKRSELTAEIIKALDIKFSF